MTRPPGTLTAASLLAFASLSAQASTVVLYDSAVASLPQDQGWLGYAATSGASPALVAGGTRLNSGSSGGTSPANEAGWANRAPLIPFIGPTAPFNPAFPVLDPAVGFSLSFELQINAESHSNNDRAGFSAILLGSDTLGIEIGFWDNEIWAQNALFTHGESVLYGTTSAPVLYDLTILGTDYVLRADGTDILSGVTRDYGDYITGTFNPDPYEVPSFVFLGDDTDSAFADFTLGTVQVNDTLPAPPAWALIFPLLPLARWVGRSARNSTPETR